MRWALKPGEESIDNGLSVRVGSQAADDSPKTPKLNLAQVPKRADKKLTSDRRTTHIETDLEEAKLTGDSLETTFGKHEWQTYRLLLND